MAVNATMANEISAYTWRRHHAMAKEYSRSDFRWTIRSRGFRLQGSLHTQGLSHAVRHLRLRIYQAKASQAGSEDFSKDPLQSRPRLERILTFRAPYTCNLRPWEKLRVLASRV